MQNFSKHNWVTDMFYRHLIGQASTPVGEFLVQSAQVDWRIDTVDRKEGD